MQSEQLNKPRIFAPFHSSTAFSVIVFRMKHHAERETSMTTEWREFEKAIARIEKALAPSEASITSPDRLPDKVTGELREVDASIRYRLGTSEVLITIECRHRSGIENVRWIEQLAEKQRSIRASITIAVSSSGFTAPAIKKAEMLGIQLRTLSDATTDDFIRWLKFQSVELVMDLSELNSISLELYDAPADAEPSPALQQLVAKDGAAARIIVRKFDGLKPSIDELLDLWERTNGPLPFGELPTDGTKVPFNIHQRVDRDLLQVETTHGVYDVRILHMGLLLSRSKQQIPFSQLSQYSDPTRHLVQSAEWKMDDIGIRFALHRDQTSGKTLIQFDKQRESNNGDR